MHSGFANRYRRWYEYEQDAHAMTLASLEASAATHPRGSSLQKAVDLFAHIVAARRLWLFRFGVAQAGPNTLFPREVALDRLKRDNAEMQAKWASYLERLEEAELDRVFEYQSLEGGWYRNTVEDILTQLFGHSWYHRGQIAQLIRSVGGEPAPTDFVFWTRRTIPRSAI